MPRYRTAYPPELRRQMVDLRRSGRTPEELAREFEPTAQSISQLGEGKTPASALMGRQAASGRNWGGFEVRTIACVRSATSWAKAAAWSARESKAKPERVYRVHEARTRPCIPFAPWPGSWKVSASGYYAWRSRPASAPGDR